jgi:hypothetical protein
VDCVPQTKDIATMEGFCEYDNGHSRFLKKRGNSTLDEPVLVSNLSSAFVLRQSCSRASVTCTSLK